MVLWSAGFGLFWLVFISMVVSVHLPRLPVMALCQCTHLVEGQLLLVFAVMDVLQFVSLLAREVLARGRR